jgi:hypothetical protein
MSKLQDAAKAYTQKRKALWKIKKQELEQELHESQERKDFAQEIYVSRQHLSMDEIAEEIDNKNKNRLYRVLRDTVPVVMVSETPTVSEPEYNYNYEIKSLPDNTYSVTVEGASITLRTNEFGEVTNVPREWYDPAATTPEQRSMYKQIISEIEQR